jgi:hypothetical protein
MGQAPGWQRLLLLQDCALVGSIANNSECNVLPAITAMSVVGYCALVFRLPYGFKTQCALHGWALSRVQQAAAFLWPFLL